MNEAAVCCCLRAVAGAAWPEAERIAGEMHDSEFLHMDETPIMIAWRQGYVWIPVGKKGGSVRTVLVKVAGGRGGTVPWGSQRSR